MILCGYGCGQEAKYPPKKGQKRWCCVDNFRQCVGVRRKNSESSRGQKGYWTGKSLSKKTIEKMRTSHKGQIPWNKGKTNIYSKETIKKMSKIGKKRIPWNKGKTFTSINNIKKKHPFFSQIEEMRYNPDKPGEKEIQVRCKNHSCPNSKEKNGWFTSVGNQIYNRIYALENQDGTDGHYFYCCENCKGECPLFKLQEDPFKSSKKKLYTQQEYQQFREFVLERDNYKCQYCNGPAMIVHHERPQKIEPFFSLDPDFAWSCCKKCHYEKGHKDECSTKKLALKNC